MRLALAATTPTPNPFHLAICQLMKLGANDDVEAFRTTFEQVAQKEQWPTGSWSQAHALTKTEAADLTRLRQGILDRAAGQFMLGCSTPEQSPRLRWTYSCTLGRPGTRERAHDHRIQLL